MRRLRPKLNANGRLLALAVVACFTAQMAGAQILYGSLVGNVADVNSAVVPHAAVTATNQDTGASKTALTNALGEYQFIDLQPGVYSLKVAAPGFKTSERRDIPVTVNNITRTEIKLEIGSIEQSVTVTGEAPARRPACGGGPGRPAGPGPGGLR